MMNIIRIGIDLAKCSVPLSGVDRQIQMLSQRTWVRSGNAWSARELQLLSQR